MFVCHVGMKKVALLTLVACAQPHLKLELKYPLKSQSRQKYFV